MKKLDTINIGQSPNDHSGDAHRTAFDRINQNFQAIGPAIGLLESQAIARPLDEPGTDLNALADTGVYYQNADERAASGKNYPLPRAGLLRVWNTGALRYQVYISDGAGTAVASHIYWRVWHAGAWTAWSRAAEQSDLQAVQALAAAAIPAAQKGAALGVATLDGQGLIPQVQVPPLRAASLPQAAHDLDGIVAPGAYRQETDAGAAAGAHYPAPRAGFLKFRPPAAPCCRPTPPTLAPARRRSAIGACAARACPGRPGQRPWPRTGSAPIVARRRASPRWTGTAPCPPRNCSSPCARMPCPTWARCRPRPTWITTRCAVCTRWRPFPPPAPASISRWPRPGTWRCCRPRGRAASPCPALCKSIGR